jgi:hypothetical protein
MDQTIGAPNRDELRALLLAWSRGEKTFYEIVEEAEGIEDRTWQNVPVIEFDADDPKRIATEVVSLLSMGFVAPLLVEDIPHLLRCLDAPEGSEEEYIGELSRQLDKFTSDKRFELAAARYRHLAV